MSENPLIWLMIPLAALLAVIFGGLLIMRLQKKLREPLFPGVPEPTGGGASGPEPTGWAASTSFQQGAGESREDFVRRHRHRPGVVADGVTLVDLYDLIRRLEHRIAVLEGERDEDMPGPRP